MNWVRGYRLGVLTLECRDCGYQLNADVLMANMDRSLTDLEWPTCPTCARVARAEIMSDRDGISPMAGAE